MADRPSARPTGKPGLFGGSRACQGLAVRTALLILLGLLLASLLLLVKAPAGRRAALFAFLLVWLGVCAVNLRVGLSHGYTLAEELPIHLALFGVPAAFALGLARVRGVPQRR